MRLLKNLLNLSAVLTILVSLAQLFPGDVHLFQLLEAFQLQTLGGSLILFVAALWMRLKWSSLVFCLAAFSMAYDCSPYYWPNSRSSGASSKTFSVIHANVWHHNSEFEATTTQLLNQQADVILIQELSEEWSAHLSESLVDFPHRVLIPHAECCYGIGLFSKFPIQNSDTIYSEDTPMLVALLEIPGLQPVDFLYLHTRPPAFPDETDRRNNQLNMVAQMLREERNTWILAGDFNVVPWANEFHELLTGTGAVDSRKGAQLTFPAKPVPLIPIDHILHDRGLHDLGMKTFEIPGSDHKGIVVSFDL